MDAANALGARESELLSKKDAAGIASLFTSDRIRPAASSALVVRQPFSFGCPACFEWPNGGACGEHQIEPQIVQPEIPVRLWLPTLAVPKRLERVSVLYQISTGFSDAWINFCVQDRHGIGKSCFGFSLLGLPEWIRVHLRILQFN